MSNVKQCGRCSRYFPLREKALRVEWSITQGGSSDRPEVVNLCPKCARVLSKLLDTIKLGELP